MKSLFFICSISFLSIMASAQAKVTIGMTLEEVKRIIPNVEPRNEYGQIFIRQPANLYGLENEWKYVFGENKKKLVMISFLTYEKTDEANFNKCLSATEKIIKEYTKYYGKPDSIAVGKTKFDPKYRLNQAPFLKYNILEAYWKNYNNMEIVVSFQIASSSVVLDKQGKAPLNGEVNISIRKKNLSDDDY